MITTQDKPVQFAGSDRPGLPGMLNVLTILTFIGSVVTLLWGFMMKWFAGVLIKRMTDPKVVQELTTKQRADLDRSMEIMAIYEQYFWPLLIISLIGVVLCVAGALQMRQLKKQGFYLYTLGELAPILASGVIMGFSIMFTTPASYIFGLGIPLLFVALYAAQLKWMK